MLETILIIDDNASNRTLLKFAVRAFCKTVLECSYGAEALAMTQNNSIDLVFVDIQLPDMNGIDLTAQIHSLSPQTVIAMSTANNRSDVMEQACQNGARFYLIKPYDMPMLKTMLEHLVAQNAPLSSPMAIIDSQDGWRNFHCSA